MKIELTWVNPDLENVSINVILDNVMVGTLRVKTTHTNELLSVIRFGLVPNRDSLTVYGSRTPLFTADEK